MARQRPLVAAASAVRWEIERHAYPGFAGIALEDAQVALWWKGAVPTAMSTVVAGARRHAPVKVRAAAHSLRELRAAAAKVRATTDVSPCGPLHAIKIPADGSGLVLAATRRHPARPRRCPRSPSRSRSSTRNRCGPSSRENDWAPWSGGAQILNQRRQLLHIRFRRAQQRTTPSTSSPPPTAASPATASPTAGRIHRQRRPPRHQDHDIALIPTSNVDNQIYIGDPNSNTTASPSRAGARPSSASTSASPGDERGCAGGPICNLKVLFYWDDREDLVEAEQMDGQQAARGGDSGGPIYSIGAGGNAIAKGTVTRSAGPRLGFQDFGTATRDFGISIAK